MNDQRLLSRIGFLDFFYVGPPKESIFLTTVYGLYFSIHILQITYKVLQPEPIKGQAQGLGVAYQPNVRALTAWRHYNSNLSQEKTLSLAGI